MKLLDRLFRRTEKRVKAEALIRSQILQAMNASDQLAPAISRVATALDLPETEAAVAIARLARQLGDADPLRAAGLLASVSTTILLTELGRGHPAG